LRFDIEFAGKKFCGAARPMSTSAGGYMEPSAGGLLMDLHIPPYHFPSEGM
jgi:hypothetical protein